MNSSISLISEAYQQVTEYDKANELAEEAAQTQRGTPENTMLSVVGQLQKSGSTGTLTYMLEHIGDLAHRVQERSGIGMAGFWEKVNRINRYLNPPKGCMNMEQELENDFVNNAIYHVKEKHEDEMEKFTKNRDKWQYIQQHYAKEIEEQKVQMKRVQEAQLKRYVEAHEKHNLPVTALGRLGKQAAIDFGKLDLQALRGTMQKIDFILKKWNNADRKQKEKIRLYGMNENNTPVTESLKDTFMNFIKPKEDPNINIFKVALYEIILKQKMDMGVAVRQTIQQQIEKSKTVEDLEKIAGQYNVWSYFKQFINFHKNTNTQP